jgi:anthranilate synthase component 1
VPGGFCHRLNRVPDLLHLAAAAPAAFPFLLDDASGQGCSVLFYAGPERLVRYADGALRGPGQGADFFGRLEDWYLGLRNDSGEENASGLPFAGGWFLFIGYEMAAVIEPRLRLPANATGLPDAFAWRCPGAVVIRHAAAADGAGPGAFAVAESAEVLEAIRDQVRDAPPGGDDAWPALHQLEAEAPERFRHAVQRVLEYLRAGDVFQVNISRRWNGRFEDAPDPIALYRRLRRSNPAPFAGLARWRSATVLSSSPERLLQVRGDRIQTRPIAGTRPRGADREQDVALSRELIDNLKERAEHIMLIDLERNDLGRVCRPGSIEVNELMVVESFAHVHHIVSNVRGVLSEAATPVQAIKAVFPGGTITGCPKVRCMEIIAELEQEGRGFYTGSMGYLGRDGSMDLNILIRSMLVEGDRFNFRTGAGIVADSQPDYELQETNDKARGLLLALQSEAGMPAHA